MGVSYQDPSVITGRSRKDFRDTRQFFNLNLLWIASGQSRLRRLYCTVPLSIKEICRISPDLIHLVMGNYGGYTLECDPPRTREMRARFTPAVRVLCRLRGLPGAHRTDGVPEVNLEVDLWRSRDLTRRSHGCARVDPCMSSIIDYDF
jgi:hypothetical protein